jgi:hypothetical protein
MVEILALGQQLAILNRTVLRPRADCKTMYGILKIIAEIGVTFGER